MHFCVMFVIMRLATQPKTTVAADCSDKTKVIHINVTNNSVHVYNFATTKLVLLPGLELGSKSLLPPKNEF